MSAGKPSYSKVNYALRPAKQVERRMFVDTFVQLMKIGFPICDYHYLGMGSVYFIDFAMFHKHLGIRKMTSVEIRASAKSRMEFNKPFDVVKIFTGDIVNFITRLSPDEKYIVWLDYDCFLDARVAKAIKLALTNLSIGSILIVTVDAMPPQGDSADEWMEYFVSELDAFLWLNPKPLDFARTKIVSANIKILDSVIKSGIAGREKIRFSPLFNILYRDSHEMLTIGGMITSDTERKSLKQLDIKKYPFLRTKIKTNPYRIFVPLITRKERLSLDTGMPRLNKKWKPDFIEKANLRAYEQIYRYYPEYTETYL